MPMPDDKWMTDDDRAEWARVDAFRAYQDFSRKVMAIEEANGGAYLMDENVDAENAIDGNAYDSTGFWKACLGSAHDAVIERAREAGLMEAIRPLGITR